MKLLFKCDTVFLKALWKSVYFKLRGKNLVVHHKVIIRGEQNIESPGPIKVGVDYVGFNSRADVTLLSIRGKLITDGEYSIGRGCRIDVGERGVVKIGHGGMINSNTVLVIMHGLTIGDNTAISWNCQILDEDFHTIEYDGKIDKQPQITIGSNVWIGCNVKIYKGVNIPSGCVVSADSVVRTKFSKENCLIAGNPARVIKENVTWKP